MDNFLETYRPPKLNQEEIDDLNSLITTSTTESVILKKLPTNKSPGPDGFTGEFYETYKKNYTNPSQTLPKDWRGGNTPKDILWRHHQPVPKPDKDTTKKENYRPISLTTIDAKILNKVLVNRIQQHIRKIIHQDQVGFIWSSQRWFNIHKSMNVAHHINK